MTEAQEIR